MRETLVQAIGSTSGSGSVSGSKTVVSSSRRVGVSFVQTGAAWLPAKDAGGPHTPNPNPTLRFKTGFYLGYVTPLQGSYHFFCSFPQGVALGWYVMPLQGWSRRPMPVTMVVLDR